MRSEEVLTETLKGAPVHITRRLQHVKNTGAWVMLQMSKVNGVELGAQEYKDSLFQRYGLDTPDLPKFCDGCNSAFSVCYAIN